MSLPYAETINYWKSGTSSPDKWIEDATRQIKNLGGRVLMEGFGKDGEGRAAYMLAFEIKGDRFKAVWPVLPSKGKNERAARIQAATMLYHDIKAKSISATVLGVRAALFSYLALPDGRTAAEVSTPELAQSIPELFGPNVRQLPSGDYDDGEYRNE